MRAQFAILAAHHAAALCTPGLAADVPAGLREITLEMRAATQSGFTPEPFRLLQCRIWTEAHYSRIFSRCAVPAGALQPLT